LDRWVVFAGQCPVVPLCCAPFSMPPLAELGLPIPPPSLRVHQWPYPTHFAPPLLPCPRTRCSQVLKDKKLDKLDDIAKMFDSPDSANAA
jgi:hypothetical protein